MSEPSGAAKGRLGGWPRPLETPGYASAFNGEMTLGQALELEGFVLPDECDGVTLAMPTDGVFVLTYTSKVTYENLTKLSKALARVSGSKGEAS